VAKASNREIVERLVRAIEAKDFDTVAALTAEDYIEEMPQSGERVRGRANHQAIIRGYPGGVGTVGASKLVGSEDVWVTGPSFNVVQIVGSGDRYTYVATAEYANGEVWHVIALLHLRDGLVAHATFWYAAPFEAPAWRAPYVERFEPMTLGSIGR
jgi:ketosteroid isomerase-like protein